MPSYKETKHPLTIRLTEPVVFLRGSPSALSGRRREEVGNAPPAMLRGLLSLHLTKPMRVSSIELELEGKSIIQWPEGVGHRRVDLPEEHKILSARSILFSAKSCATSTRSASLGPGVRSLDDHDDHIDQSRFATPQFRHDSLGDTPLTSGSRRNSADLYGWPQSPSTPNAIAPSSASHPPTPSASPPYTPEPVYLALSPEIPLSRSQTPPTDSRLEGNLNGLRHEDNPGQVLEENRNALRMELSSAIHSTSSHLSPSSSPQTPEPTATSISTRSITDDSSAPPATPPPTVRSNRSLLPTSDHEHEHGPRHTSRWSLSSMSNVFKDVKSIVHNGSPKDTERHRERSHERRSNATAMHPGLASEEREGRRRHKDHQSALGKLTAAVGFDETPSVDGWKEFRKGTYTYPISFSIPPSTPPTLHCDYGSVFYRLKAVVHRPGVLTAKIATTTEVVLVASPADDGSDDTHSVVVEQQWDTHLRYLIALSGRSFPIGSRISLNFTMVPLEKCKVHRVSVFLEEKTQYYAHSRNTVRQQRVKRFELLSIRHAEKDGPPILPLRPEDIALLTPYLDATTLTSSPDEALSALMGPGPWTLNHELQIPAECGRIRFTYKHKAAQISVQHILKIIFRVQRGDDSCVDSKTGKRRLYDIVVHTPIHILSCLCDAEQIALPRYSLSASASARAVDGAPLRTCACMGWSATRTFATPANSRPSTADPTSTDAQRANRSYQFARLVSGQESVQGEAPPEYRER